MYSSVHCLRHIVSSNVVSVLQGGAFFGALASAPVSCASRNFRPLLFDRLLFHVFDTNLDGQISFFLCMGIDI